MDNQLLFEEALNKVLELSDEEIQSLDVDPFWENIYDIFLSLDIDKL